jgi:hypothetical protein
MTCTPASCGCIAFKHSAGPSNCDPCNDLGGVISSCDITCDELDNLFHSIGPKLSRKGHEDYRCFYIKNISDTYTLRNAIIYLSGTGSGVPGHLGGTYVAIGVLLKNEIQQVVVNGLSPPFEGEYFELQVPGYPSTFKVFYSPNITEWVGNFQTAIRAVEGMPEVVVKAVGIVPNVTFTIDYGGHETTNAGEHGTQDHFRWTQASHRLIDLITVVSNNLQGCTVTPFPVQDGSPVNTVATTIPDEITPPDGIPFNYYLRGNPVRVGDLRPGDFVPLWIRRTLPFPDPAFGALARQGQMAKLLDDFQITIDATYP